MGFDFTSSHFSGERDDWFRYHPRGRSKVLLREPEKCWECGKVFISLYPLKNCADHEGLDELYSLRS